MPAANIGVGAEAGIPLGDFVDFATVVEFLHVAAAPGGAGVSDGVVPVDVEGEFLAWLERLGEVDLHDGVDDAVGEFLAFAVDEAVNVEASVEGFLEQKGFEGVVGHFSERRGGAGLVSH